MVVIAIFMMIIIEIIIIEIIIIVIIIIMITLNHFLGLLKIDTSMKTIQKSSV